MGMGQLPFHEARRRSLRANGEAHSQFISPITMMLYQVLLDIKKPRGEEASKGLLFLTARFLLEIPLCT
jgi:hypothetical protein